MFFFNIIFAQFAMSTFEGDVPEISIIRMKLTNIDNATYATYACILYSCDFLEATSTDTK